MIANMTDILPPLLRVPPEIRQLIYAILFVPSREIGIEAAGRAYEYGNHNSETTSFASDFESFAIARHELSSQLLRVCRQLHLEAILCLYSQRTFNLRIRETRKLLLHNIGARNFAQIKNIIIPWDELQSFAWDLVKDEYKTAMAGLRCVQLADMRIRHMRGTSMRWRNVKSYERMMMQAASDIITKHDHLKVLAETRYQKKTSIPQEPAHIWPASNFRVIWRFITGPEELREGEDVVDVQGDLESLQATHEEAIDDGFSLPSIDPF